MITIEQIRELTEGLDVDVEEILKVVGDHADIVVNPDKIKLIAGWQEGGEGVYTGVYEIFYGSLDEHELEYERREERGLITRIKYIYKVDKDRPLIAFTHAYDTLPDGEHRCYECVLYIVNPNLKG